ncbi:hypothetical protein GO491_10215 [Flavobacteriaceae bacterium Ap0902]|nr:hypothetical protein [Flavobacteriaceae bacterium Ap0902]
MRLVYLFFILFFFVQCKNREERSHIKLEESKAIPSKDTASWTGIYKGTVPSKTSVAMDMRLSLKPSSTYDLEITYLEKNPRNNKTVDYSGEIGWGTDSLTIILNEVDTISNKFRVRKNFVEYLNPDGTPNTGELAEFYILNRQTP